MDKIKKSRENSRHLNQFDRDRIDALSSRGHKQTDIAKILDVDKSTISREINERKKKNGHYDATTAQHKANLRRANSKYQGMKIEKYPVLRNHIISELKKHRSPDEIAGRMLLEGWTIRVGTNAIYKWLYSARGQAYTKYLCTRRYRRKKQKRTVKREMIPNRISIEKRPFSGEHAEGDTFVSPTKLKTTFSGAILCIPSAKLIVGTMIPNRKPATMVKAVNEIIGKIKIDDLTLDNGIENKYHEQFSLSAYFADPHSPWQKPHIEGSIGLLRRWFIPKRTDLRTVEENTFQHYLHILNSKYRKSLGYKTAYEVALSRGIIQKIPHIQVAYLLR